MSRYIYTIRPTSSTLKEIYKNDGIVTWSIPCTESKIRQNDKIFLYVAEHPEEKCNETSIISFTKRIAFVATVIKILGPSKSNKKSVLLNIEEISPNFSEKLIFDNSNNSRINPNVNNLSNYGFYPPQSYPIDLGEKKYEALSNYIDSVMSECGIIPAIPQTYEECLASDYFAMKKFFQIDEGCSRKINGNISANLIRKYIQRVINSENLPYFVSPINSYIYGYGTEWDALILRKNAYNILDYNIYDPYYVVSVLEFKCNGIFYNASNPEKASAPLKNFITSSIELKKEKNKKGLPLTVGYITITETETHKKQGEQYFTETLKAFSASIPNRKNLIADCSYGFCVIDNGNKRTLYHNNTSWVNFVLKLLPKE